MYAHEFYGGNGIVGAQVNNTFLNDSYTYCSLFVICILYFVSTSSEMLSLLFIIWQWISLLSLCWAYRIFFTSSNAFLHFAMSIITFHANGVKYYFFVILFSKNAFIVKDKHAGQRLWHNLPTMLNIVICRLQKKIAFITSFLVPSNRKKLPFKYLGSSGCWSGPSS